MLALSNVLDVLYPDCMSIYEVGISVLYVKIPTSPYHKTLKSTISTGWQCLMSSGIRGLLLLLPLSEGLWNESLGHGTNCLTRCLVHTKLGYGAKLKRSCIKKLAPYQTRRKKAWSSRFPGNSRSTTLISSPETKCVLIMES